MGAFDMNLVIGLLVLAALVAAAYALAPNMFTGLMHVRPAPVMKRLHSGAEMFTNIDNSTETMVPVPMQAAKKPAGCYPREQLNPAELLPQDVNSAWAQVNPQGAGDIQGKNFLSAGALVGVNTIGQSLRNANYQLRAEPPNPQVQVGPWMQTTIEPDLQRRPLE